MRCPACQSQTFSFAVPETLREYAPDESPAASICTTCLRVSPAEAGASDPDFDAVLSDFPDGEAGVALALALGRLDSFALNRAGVVNLCEHAERAGADVLLLLDRLASSGRIEPHFDIDRRRRNVAQALVD
ncbi:MAG: DUF6276 family protein [Halobacteriota archaeon]